MKIEEGYIKFECILNKSSFDFPQNLYEEINSWRKKLYNKKLIGANPDGIGYGNISIRNGKSTFIITGTATGIKTALSIEDYVLITGYNLSKNQVICTGEKRASAETMSHAAVYEGNSGIEAIIHIHHLGLWEKLRDKLPTTSYEVEYGTPQMAYEIIRLFRETDVFYSKIFVMGGHKEGIISFGKNLNEAGDVILKYFNLYLNNKLKNHTVKGL